MQTDSTKGLNTQNAVERFVVFIWEVIQGTNIPNLAYVPNMTLVGANLPVGTFFPLHNDHFYPILQSFFAVFRIHIILIWIRIRGSVSVMMDLDPDPDPR